MIRSLVPSGVAEKDGRLIPGDRLLGVNGASLEKASLDEAVAALKGAPKGPVIISVAKPISVLESPGQVSETDGESWEMDHHGLGQDSYDHRGHYNRGEKNASRSRGCEETYESSSGMLSVSQGAASLLKSESF